MSPSTPSTEVLTVKEVAALLRVSTATLYRSLERGEIPKAAAALVGGQYRLRRAELLARYFGEAVSA